VHIANAPLHPVSATTTVRVRGDEVDFTDGPFATTKEILAGYYVLDCPDLELALQAAARLPTARYGSVEVRPVMDPGSAQRGSLQLAHRPTLAAPFTAARQFSSAAPHQSGIPRRSQIAWLEP